MKNILKIIASDIRRLTTNVVAVVVLMGLTVIPSLYAWFNILSNWDPYGAEATSNLQVAVASMDEGVTLGSRELNVGKMILDNLAENKSIGWVFLDTQQEAVDGVNSGKYYAAIVVDSDFSENLISFLSGKIENPNIHYYENEKKNAIAPKITGKVKTTIQNSVNQAFVSTMTKTLMSTSEYLVQTDQNGNLSGAAIERLKQLNQDMNAVVLLLDSYIALMDSAEKMMQSTGAVSDSVDALMHSAEAMAQSGDSAVDTARTSVETMGKVMESSFKTLYMSLDSLTKSVTEVSNKVQSGVEKSTVAITTAKALIPQIKQQKEAILALAGNYLTQEQKDEFEKNFTNLETDLNALDAQNQATAADVKKSTDTILADIEAAKTSVSALELEYKNHVAPQMTDTMTKAQSSIREIERMLNYKSSNIDYVAKCLGNYPDMMSLSKETLQKSRDEAASMQEKLGKVIDLLDGMSANPQYQKFLELAKNDPEQLGDFISSPVKVEEEYVYPVANNGSMTAPFYIVLSIWVGALIMSTILKTEVKNRDEFKDLKNYQCFWGRYFTTFVVGQIQVLITVLGALFFVKIQCKNGFLLYLACAWTAFVYSLLLYSFTYAFGNVGEALSVILMVIQVAGAGGTFPIEVLPNVFRVLYRFMPFNYSMNAVRECIGGRYHAEYWIYLAILIVYVAIACLNGLVLYRPSKAFNHKIEKSKEKSGILI